MVGMASAVKQLKLGKTRTEALLYFLSGALIIAAVILIIDVFLPGTEFLIGGRTFYISHDFYRANFFGFLMFGTMLGSFLSSIVIHLHRRSVKKRLIVASKIGRR